VLKEVGLWLPDLACLIQKGLYGVSSFFRGLACRMALPAASQALLHPPCFHLSHTGMLLGHDCKRGGCGEENSINDLPGDHVLDITRELLPSRMAMQASVDWT